jgi:hypothetical protein
MLFFILPSWFTYYFYRLQPEQLAKLRHYLGIEADLPAAETGDQTQLLKVNDDVTSADKSLKRSEQKWFKVVCNANIVYGNLKSENSQDYAQKPQRNCMFMNSASVWDLPFILLAAGSKCP